MGDTPGLPNDLAAPPWPAAWWVWVLGQAVVLAAYAAGFKFAGGYPEPVEVTADLGVAVTQVLLASLLGPALLGSPRRLVRAAAAGAVFGTLAAGLATTSVGDAARLAAVEIAWIVAVAVAPRAARPFLTLLGFGGPVLWYVAQEYGPRPTPLGTGPTLLVPALGMAATRLHRDARWPFLSAIAVGVIASLPRLTPWRRQKLLQNLQSR